MAKKIIITIARQYGSGGREIGERVAALLNIPIYDRLLITESAAKGNFNENVLSQADESAANSLLYTLAMGSNTLGAAMHFGYKMPLNDKLFLLQSEVIRESAKKGSGVYIGRCADYVLREEPCVLRVFIHGDLAHREARVKERHPELKSSQIINVIEKTDKRRSTYYNFYTGNKWGHFENYDLLVNSSTLGIQGTAKLIANLARKIMAD
jgi:cytidylate kinase